MSDRIMNINQLQIGKPYRIITNAGYFDCICYLKKFVAEFAVLVDEGKREHFVHTLDMCRSENPIIIKPV